MSRKWEWSFTSADMDRWVSERLKHFPPPIEYYDSVWRKLIKWDIKCFGLDFQQCRSMDSEELARWDKCALGWDNEEISKLDAGLRERLLTDLGYVYEWRKSNQRRRDFENGYSQGLKEGLKRVNGYDGGVAPDCKSGTSETQ